MWPSYHDAGVGLACVEQGITGVHDLPSDILTDWENLPDLDVGHQLQPLAWETTHEDSAALLADKLPDSGGQGYSIVAAEPTTDTQHHAAADTGRCKQEVNRLAQKKSRQKKQARLQETQRQLTQATAELQQLKLQHNQLKSRNLLLEKSAQLIQQSQHKSQRPAEQDHQQQAPLGLHNIAQQTEQGLSICLTALGEGKKMMTLSSIACISHTEFASIYTVYAKQMGQDLLDLSDDCKDSYTTNMSLRRLTSELNALTHSLAAVNPKTFQEFHNKRLDGHAGPVSSDLSEAFYLEVLAAKNLTNDQVHDLLHLRRMFYGRLGQLMLRRKQLLTQVPETGLHPSVQSHTGAQDMDQLAQQLKASGTDEYHAYTTFASVFFRGIQTFKQHAVDIVAAYPWIPDKHRMMELLASQRGEPSVQFYLDGAGLDDFQHEANWQEIVAYLQSLNANNLHKHVPLINNKPLQSAATWVTSAREKTVYDLLR